MKTPGEQAVDTRFSRPCAGDQGLLSIHQIGEQDDHP